MKDFTSLPPAEEQTFLVYEQSTRQNSHKALVAALASAGAVFVVLVVIVFAFGGSDELEERFGEDGQEEVEKKELGAEKEAAKPAAAEAPKEEAPAAAEGEGAEAAEGAEPAEGEATE